MHNEELHDLYSSLNLLIIIRVITSMSIGWNGHGASMAGKTNAYRIVEEKPERKRQFGRLRSIWEDNIKMDIDWEVVDNTGLGLGQVADSCERGNKHSGSIKYEEIL
jgi:hypothetical protein